MLGQRRENLSGVQGINMLETACVKDKMDLFSPGPDPAKPICYQRNQWRKTWDRNRVPAETLTQPSSHTLTAVRMAGHVFRAFNKHHYKQ